jgi:hypothetical protein
MGAHPTHTGNGSILAIYDMAFYASINCPNVFAGNVSDTSGMYIASRTGASTLTFYRNSSKLSESSQAAGAIYNNDLRALCRGVAGSPSYRCTKQESIVFVSGGLSETEAIAASDAFNTYMEARGKGVYSGSYEGEPAPPPTGGILNNNPSFENPSGSGDWYLDWKPSTQNTQVSVLEIIEPPPSALHESHVLHTQAEYPDGWPSNPVGWNRCEVVTRAQLGGSPEKGGGYTAWHDEHWWGMAVYLPDWAQKIYYNPSINEAAWTTVLQIHGIPNNWQWNVCLSGPNALSLVAEDGFFSYSNVGEPHLAMHSLIIANPYTTPPASVPHTDPSWWIPIGLAENRWLKFVMNFIVSPDSDGKVKLWVAYGKNARYALMVDERGPNTYYYDRSCGPAVQENLMQLGIYKSRINIQLVDQYYDEIRYGEIGNSDFYTVAPLTGYSGIGWDWQPVYIGGETLNSTTLELEWHEPLESGYTDGTHAVTVDGIGQGVSAPTIVGGKLRVTVGSAISSGAVVKYTYTSPGGGSYMRGISGTAVATFESVQNGNVFSAYRPVNNSL